MDFQLVGPLEVAFRVAGKAKQRRPQELVPQHRQGADIVGIDGERLFAKRVGRIRLLADRLGLKLARGALESQVLGVTIGRRRPFDACALGLDELKGECVRQTCDDRVLRLQQIGPGRVELFGPEVSRFSIEPHSP